MHRTRRLAAAVSGASLAAALALTAAAPAQGPPAPAPPPAGPPATVVASGLNNPRGLALRPNGSLLVAEAGRAGRTCLRRPEICLGLSSGVREIRGSRVRRIARGLPSLGGPDGSFAAGANAVSVAPDGTVFTITSSTEGPAQKRALPGAFARGLGKLVRIRGGRTRFVAAIDSYEFRRNPDREDVNSNPYAVLGLSRTRAIVVDAGANAVYDVRGSRVRLLAVLPRNGRAQSVPTSIARGPDGAYYVGEFVGGGQTAGNARVFRIRRGRPAEVAHTGFTAITGLAFGPDGSLYVTQFNETGGEQDVNGVVVRVAPDGNRTFLGRGQLFVPAGAAVGSDGSVYVSNWSVLPGRAATQGPFAGRRGEVVRLAPAA